MNNNPVSINAFWKSNDYSKRIGIMPTGEDFSIQQVQEYCFIVKISNYCRNNLTDEEFYDIESYMAQFMERYLEIRIIFEFNIGIKYNIEFEEDSNYQKWKTVSITSFDDIYHLISFFTNQKSYDSYRMRFYFVEDAEVSFLLSVSSILQQNPAIPDWVKYVNFRTIYRDPGLELFIQILKYLIVNGSYELWHDMLKNINNEDTDIMPQIFDSVLECSNNNRFIEHLFNSKVVPKFDAQMIPGNLDFYYKLLFETPNMELYRAILNCRCIGITRMPIQTISEILDRMQVTQYSIELKLMRSALYGECEMFKLIFNRYHNLFDDINYQLDFMCKSLKGQEFMKAVFGMPTQQNHELIRVNWRGKIDIALYVFCTLGAYETYNMCADYGYPQKSIMDHIRNCPILETEEQESLHDKIQCGIRDSSVLNILLQPNLNTVTEEQTNSICLIIRTMLESGICIKEKYFNPLRFLMMKYPMVFNPFCQFARKNLLHIIDGIGEDCINEELELESTIDYLIDENTAMEVCAFLC